MDQEMDKYIIINNNYVEKKWKWQKNNNMGCKTMPIKKEERKKQIQWNENDIRSESDLSVIDTVWCSETSDILETELWNAHFKPPQNIVLKIKVKFAEYTCI